MVGGGHPRSLLVGSSRMTGVNQRRPPSFRHRYRVHSRLLHMGPTSTQPPASYFPWRLRRMLTENNCMACLLRPSSCDSSRDDIRVANVNSDRLVLERCEDAEGSGNLGAVAGLPSNACDSWRYQCRMKWRGEMMILAICLGTGGDDAPSNDV